MKTNAQNNTAIISGASGYFGGIACQYFEANGWNILKAGRQDDAHIRLDLDHPETLLTQKLDTEVDLFIHAAAAHAVTCHEQPYRAVLHNVAGTRAALDFCVATGIQKFIYISTFHVFGHPMGDIDELSQPMPANDYGLSHLQAEEYVRMYTRERKISGIVIRPSNFFGIPGNLKQYTQWVLTPLAFCRDAVEKKQIVLNTPGFQQRNFISISDVCATIQAISSCIKEVPLLHIVGPDTLKIRDLAKLIKQIMYDYFNKRIDLIIPDGVIDNDHFIYKSRYLNDIYKPTDRIEKYIINFCKQLSQRVLL